MEGANLWQVNLSKANLSTTRLKGADIKNPFYCDTEMPWGVERLRPNQTNQALKFLGYKIGPCMSTVEAMKRGKAATKRFETKRAVEQKKCKAEIEKRNRTRFGFEGCVPPIDNKPKNEKSDDACSNYVLIWHEDYWLHYKGSYDTVAQKVVPFTQAHRLYHYRNGVWP